VTLYWALTAIAGYRIRFRPPGRRPVRSGARRERNYRRSPRVTLVSMKNLRLAILPLACLCGLLAAPASALADEASFLYDPGTVNVIEMTLPDAAIVKLEEEPFTYQKGGTISIAKTDGSPPPGGKGNPSVTCPNAEIKLKGQLLGSFQDLSRKAAFKVKFKKTEPCVGLRKLTLNNMTQDPSMVHESLAYRAFAAAGVPASRSGYAYVWLNGTNYGLHLDLESLDTISLPKIFQVPQFDSATQHLYEAAEYGADFYPGKESRFEVDEGEEDESDLTALIAAVDAAAPSGSIPPSLAAMVDLPEMTRMWATEKYIGHWDGYAGAGIPGEEEFNERRPNNYYLYTDSSGRFSMLPWGTDQTWDTAETEGEPIEFDGQDGRLFDLCREDETCAGLFSAAVDNALRTIEPLELDAEAAETAAMLAPWQALEAAPRKPFSAAQISAAVADTCDFITARPAEAEQWLEGHPPPGGFTPPKEALRGPPCTVRPPAPPSEPDPTVEPISTAGNEQPSTAPTTPASKPHARVRLHGPVFQNGRLLKVRATLSDPGWVRLAGELKPATGSGPIVCLGQGRSRPAGSHWISCRLSRPAWRQLRSHALAIVLTASFEANGGASDDGIRLLELNRRTGA
jgi:hypothetical protein